MNLEGRGTQEGQSESLSNFFDPINVTNRLDPIEELYKMYSEEEDTPRIVEIEDNGLDFVLDTEGLADPYMDL